jgi:hypothetical protein
MLMNVYYAIEAPTFEYYAIVAPTFEYYAIEAPTFETETEMAVVSTRHKL